MSLMLQSSYHTLKTSERIFLIIMYQNTTINSEEKSNVLVDKTQSGKVIPWREKKIDNVRYWELLHILEFNKAERVKDCAEVLRLEERRVGKEWKNRWS